MSSRRLGERIAGARTLGPGCVHERRLVCNKPGRDGSGKANLVVHPGSRVWGALYRLSSEDWSALDGYEGGYQRRACEVQRPTGGVVAAQTYLWTPTDAPAIPPFDWYRDLLLEGAREHGLPVDYIAQLESLSCVPDPTRAR